MHRQLGGMEVQQFKEALKERQWYGNFEELIFSALDRNRDGIVRGAVRCAQCPPPVMNRKIEGPSWTTTSGQKRTTEATRTPWKRDQNTVKD